MAMLVCVWVTNLRTRHCIPGHPHTRMQRFETVQGRVTWRLQSTLEAESNLTDLNTTWTPVEPTFKPICVRPHLVLLLSTQSLLYLKIFPDEWRCWFVFGPCTCNLDMFFPNIASQGWRVLEGYWSSHMVITIDVWGGVKRNRVEPKFNLNIPKFKPTCSRPHMGLRLVEGNTSSYSMTNGDVGLSVGYNLASLTFYSQASSRRAKGFIWLRVEPRGYYHRLSILSQTKPIWTQIHPNWTGM